MLVKKNIITARVRSMMGRYCFHRCLTLTPSPSHNTSTGPMSFLGVPQWLVPGPFPGGTPARSRSRGTYPMSWDGVLPWLGQQKEYLLHGEWYASCVHAGGLSRLLINPFISYAITLLLFGNTLQSLVM